MWAVKVDEIGKSPAAFERVESGAQTPSGYDFVTDVYPAGKVVDTDGQSLRDKSASEDLDDLKYEKWLEIKAYRDAIKKGGVLVATKWFHTDDASRIQQIGLVRKADRIIAAGGALSDPIPIDGAVQPWKTLDDSFTDMTCQIAYDIEGAIGILDSKAFANAETHRANMEASQDPANYDYSTGWPTTYLYG